MITIKNSYYFYLRRLYHLHPFPKAELGNAILETSKLSLANIFVVPKLSLGTREFMHFFNKAE